MSLKNSGKFGRGIPHAHLLFGGADWDDTFVHPIEDGLLDGLILTQQDEFGTTHRVTLSSRQVGQLRGLLADPESAGATNDNQQQRKQLR